MRTIGLSPKIIGPVVAALAAFEQAKIHDAATATLVIALTGAVALYFSPPGAVADPALDGAFDGVDAVDPLDAPDDDSHDAPIPSDLQERPESAIAPRPPTADEEERA